MVGRRYAALCGVLALVLIPGAIPVTIGVIAARAIRRAVLRRQVRRIVVAAGGWRPEYRGEA